MSDKDTIYRQDAIDALRREYNTEDSDFPTEYQLGLSAGRRIIDELPSAQFIEQEQKTGKWEEENGSLWKDNRRTRWGCSACGKHVLITLYGDPIKAGLMFCPNCGATMEDTIQSLSYRDLEIMEDFITGVPAEEIAQRFETTVDSILTTLEEMVEKIREEVNQVWDKMEE